ncbi:tautomerase [Natrononativus amylolyticus]|uniref:tautomerase n=1 Tax=Natrononativus amylolyticus TaxID=2963434 RepID=UPI0020CD0910|nr:tautomerase [Natrononativus amylolyticus]
MPLLQFDTTVELTGQTKREFAEAVRERYGEIMQTGTGHVAITVRPREPSELSLGREVDDDRLLFLDADIREGRPFEVKREFVLAVMDLAADEFGVPKPNMKAVVTEHRGAQMMGYDRVGSEWRPEDGES